jgi:PleD family two-component response regulator
MSTKKKILLVDDSGVTLMMEKMILEREAYDLVVAKNGQEAVECARRERPDLVLLDLIMPGMNGLETCAKLRDQEETRDTPVIMVTTRGEAHFVEKAYELGCTDYITKPVNSLELLTKVRNCLAADRAEGADS